MNQDLTKKIATSVWKKIRAEGFTWKKKFLHKQWAKQKFVQAENSPPPHHFSNYPSLSYM